MAKGIAHRDWTISRDEFRGDDSRIDEASFRAAVQNEMALAEHIGERLGVAIVAAPVRTRVGDGAWFTVAWAFKTASIPGVRDEPAAFDLDRALDGDAALVEDADALAHVE